MEKPFGVFRPGLVWSLSVLLAMPAAITFRSNAARSRSHRRDIEMGWWLEKLGKICVSERLSRATIE